MATEGFERSDLRSAPSGRRGEFPRPGRRAERHLAYTVLAPRPVSPPQTDQKTGLTQAMYQERFATYGLNELPEKKVNPLLMFLAYFWGPMPIMIWAAVLIELGQASAGLGGWDDFTVLMILQFANAIVGYIEERNAGDAIQVRHEPRMAGPGRRGAQRLTT